MNDQAEFEVCEIKSSFFFLKIIIQIGRQIPLSDVFRRDYAQLIQWLAHLNEYLAKYLDEINQICRQVRFPFFVRFLIGILDRY